MKNRFDKIKFTISYKFLFRLKVWLKRKITKFLKTERPISFPYITGDGFRSLAQHFFDDISDFNPSKILEGDIIFVRLDMVHDFFKKVDPKIKNKYILVSHNADYTISETEFSKYNRSKIIQWFAQNLKYNDPRITPIPIGLTNYRYRDEVHVFKNIKTPDSEKKNKILISFRATNTDRMPLRNKLINLKTVDETGEVSKQDYFKKISEYKFILSPEGNGPDCHRTWESMYLRSVPIVLRNTYTEFFYKIGLPIFLVEKWDDLLALDENFLEKKYEELSNRFSSPALFMDYWQKLIIETRK
jgi:hypothetical protein